MDGFNCSLEPLHKILDFASFDPRLCSTVSQINKVHFLFVVLNFVVFDGAGRHHVQILACFSEFILHKFVLLVILVLPRSGNDTLFRFEIAAC